MPEVIDLPRIDDIDVIGHDEVCHVLSACASLPCREAACGARVDPRFECAFGCSECVEEILPEACPECGRLICPDCAEKLADE